MAKVLIVDDSALTRKYLSNILSDAGFDIEIARNGQECLDKMLVFKPDAITLDVNMPVMDGLTCLKVIMQKCPTPVIMVSSVTAKGAKVTLQALELGAFDYAAKPNGAILSSLGDDTDLLIRKVHTATKTKLRPQGDFKNIRQIQAEKLINKNTKKYAFDNKSSLPHLIVIGVSTGGPKCLQTILQDLPANFPVPIVVAQHMPARFTEAFSARLNTLLNLRVKEVVKSDCLEAGTVYIAKGNADIVIKRNANTLIAESVTEEKEYVWHPSVNRLVHSAAEKVRSNKLICIQLTGMGNDGADAMHKAYQNGATTIAESAQTAVVYGMPKELVKRQGATQELPNTRIAQALLELVSQ